MTISLKLITIGAPHLSCILKKFLMVYCHPFGISPPRRTQNHLQTQKVHAVLLPGKKKNRCYIRWNPAYSYRKHRADASLTKGTPHYLYLLFPVSGAKSHHSCLLKYFSLQSLEEEFKCDPCAHRITPVQGLLWVLWRELLLESARACLLAACPFHLGLSWGPWVPVHPHPLLPGASPRLLACPHCCHFSSKEQALPPPARGRSFNFVVSKTGSIIFVSVFIIRH